MPKYLFLQRSVPGKSSQPPSPAQMQEMFAAFNAWKEKFTSNIVDMGGKLKAGGTVVTTSGATDGPFVEAKEVVGGYMLVAAETVEQALEVARESPGVMMPGSSIEVREIQEMPTA
ncbi:MAG: YciI family protein [Vicinamibacteraceae bacterium]